MTCATTDDIRLLRAIEVASDGLTTAALIRDYYRDGDRSDRTSREFLYLHLGMLSGIIERMWREQAAAPPAPTAEQNCWIVTDYEGGGIRGVFQAQSDAEAEIAAICADHEDLTRRDFIIGTYRVHPAAPPERVSGKENLCQTNHSDGMKKTSSEPAKKDAPNAATRPSRMPEVAPKAAATSGDAQPVNERGSLKSETDAARPAVESREEPR